MAKSELVYEFLGSRNLNTTPIDITGLQGGKYDYELVVFKGLEASNGQVRISFNNDLTANYRKYWMEAQVSGSFAFVADSDSYINTETSSVGDPALFMGSIIGSSGGERLIDCGIVKKGSTVTNVIKQSSYWKNTVDEINSMQLHGGNSVSIDYHILLYRVPKAANQANWEKVGELNWAAETAEKSFTGLDGNRDKKYKIEYNLDQELSAEINNDATAKYIRQRLQNSAGAISANNSTENSIVTDGKSGNIVINAATGVKRLCISSASNTSAAQQSERSVWYNETITNVTSLDLTPISSASGKAVLYRMKGNGETSGTLPWELIESVDISGDFSAGHTFSNLTGNSEKLFRLEFLGENASGGIELRSQVNSDTSNINVEQLLKGDTSTVTAASATRTYIVNCKLQNGDRAHSNTIIYPRIGSDRPILTECTYDENALEKLAQWYGESVTEITSLKVYASTLNSVTGKLKLWRLK